MRRRVFWKCIPACFNAVTIEDAKIVINNISTKSNILSVTFLFVSLTLGSCASNQPKSKNMQIRYEAYTADRIAFADAESLDTEESYIEYLTHYPRGIFQKRATNRLNFMSEERRSEHLTYISAKENKTIEEYQRYVGKYPNGSHYYQAKAEMDLLVAARDEERKKEKRLYESAKKSNSAAKRYKSYLKKYPRGTFYKQAKIELKLLDKARTKREMSISELPAGISFEQLHKDRVNASVLFSLLQDIEYIEKGQFEKNAELETRKRNALKKLDETYFLEMEEFRMSYDADSEVWNLKLEHGDYSYENTWLNTNKNIEFLVRSETDTGSYIGSNAFGASVKVTSNKTNEYLLAITNRSVVKALKRRFGSGQDNIFKTSMPIQKAKSMAHIEFEVYALFVLDFDGKFQDKKWLKSDSMNGAIFTDNYVSEATITSPWDVKVNKKYIRVNPRGIVVRSKDGVYMNYMQIAYSGPI